MMARLTVKGHKLSLSGSYGADGLTKDVPKEVYELGVDLPDELRKAWSEGGGWNSAGSEGPKMFEWAQSIMKPAKKRAA